MKSRLWVNSVGERVSPSKGDQSRKGTLCLDLGGPLGTLLQLHGGMKN
jgi:hypothetical protein